MGDHGNRKCHGSMGVNEDGLIMLDQKRRQVNKVYRPQKSCIKLFFDHTIGNAPMPKNLNEVGSGS